MTEDYMTRRTAKKRLRVLRREWVGVIKHATYLARIDCHHLSRQAMASADDLEQRIARLERFLDGAAS